MDNKIVRDLNLPVMGKKLLRQLANKEITFEEFMKECSYWKLQYLDSFRCRPEPSMPAELSVILAEKKKDSSVKIDSKLWEQPFVKAYVIQSAKVESLNRSNYVLLLEIYKYLPEEDIINRKKVKDYIREFGGFWAEINKRHHTLAKQEELENVEYETADCF